MYVVFSIITSADPSDASAFPIHIVLASDHAVYIGVITNVVLSVISVLVLDQATRRGWLSHVAFWGINLGLLVFAIGLIAQSAEIKRIGAPVMGLVLYLTLAVLAWRAFSAPLDSAEADLEPA
jgi:hypothetical protein